MPNKKIFELASITDEDLSNLNLLWMVGDPDIGTLYKPTLEQLKALILGDLVANGILLSDGDSITQDASDFSWNPSTNALAVVGSGTFGASSYVVTIITPTNPGYTKTISIDQPNCQINLRNGNGDANGGGYIKRVALNNGEFRIGSAQTQNPDTSPLDGFITFYCNAAEAARITKNGMILPKLTTTARDAIVSPATGLTIYNTTDNEIQFYNGSAWVSTASGGGSIDYSLHTITYGATPTLDGDVGTNFKITLTGDATFSFANLVIGKDYYLTLIQDATGGREVTLPANSKAPLGAFSSGQILATTSGANAEDDIRIRYDGTNYRIYLSKNMG